MARVLKEGIVSRNPRVVSGALVFTGTRVPVKNLVDYLKAGHPLDWSTPSTTKWRQGPWT
jgi:uncharacterized protein (DUF433 family)